MFLKLLVVFSICVSYAAAGVVNTVDCKDTTAHSKDVQMEVSGCDTDAERCPLLQGHNHTVVFIFEPTRPFLNKTDFRVYGLFPKFSVPYKGKADACEPSRAVVDGTTCTELGGFVTGKQYRHESIFSVAKTYPKIKLSVRFTMTDRRSKEMLLCKEIPVEIKSPPSPEENEATK
ncbi:uncharacterized protein LOC129227656 [Uloborus diversus]|uniref:uncharacterized protein LOC129227656 n=1 Tax=Uloborus diversus TaxID=327109 RepID=UPI0024096359|nr:uncharacterized protein LOC129227656 [Uloborus diversus]